MDDTTDLDDEAVDWAAADAAEDDYLDDDAVRAATELVADGTQDVEPGEPGWAAPDTRWQEVL